MRFNPAISIALGVITTFVFSTFVGIFFYHISNLGNMPSWFILFIIFGFLLGGFIATNFAKVKKIRYGSCEGVILGIITLITSYAGTLYVPGAQFDIFQGIFMIVMFALISSIGGYIAKSWGEPIQKTLSIFKGLKKT
jgi:MFS family permease